MIDLKEGIISVEYYLDEIERINAIKKKKKRYNDMIKLVNKWSSNDNKTKVNLTDGFIQYLNEMFYSYLEMYKPTSFKEKFINLESNMNMFGR